MLLDHTPHDARVKTAWRHRAVFLLLVAAAAGCSPTAAIRELRDQPRTPHEQYARSLREAGLDSTAIGRDWLLASDSALRSPLALALPAREVGVYQRNEARAVAYRIALRDGERLRVSLRVDGLPARLYMDLFEMSGDSLPVLSHLASAGTVDSAATADSLRPVLQLTYEARRSGDYLLRFQPELLRSGRYELIARTEPMLAFPVEGRGNAAIQSLFGVDRDGGRRSHHGIDIFAPRGTPVLAATNGTVRSISPNELGGNVVWLVDEVRRQTLYYAHLDRHHVVAGQRVLIGDTLGFVGNTGNARTTAPHLHFGIYRRPEGPIDPLRYVRLNTANPDRLTADSGSLGRFAETRLASVPLRAAQRDSSGVLRRIARATRLQIMAANAGSFRVQLDDGSSGYVNESAVRIVDR